MESEAPIKVRNLGKSELSGSGIIARPRTPADPQPITIHPLCAACGREVAAYQSLCETCEQELMSQPPSWTANRL